jgi:hypothetical protein
LDDVGNALYIAEIKGVNGGARREQVNQVDSHRERLGISSDVPGLLIINDFMGIEDFEERKKKTFDAQILIHAQRLNVKILRTTTLLEIMLACEVESDRKHHFLNACKTANPMVPLPENE